MLRINLVNQNFYYINVSKIKSNKIAIISFNPSYTNSIILRSMRRMAGALRPTPLGSKVNYNLASSILPVRDYSALYGSKKSIDIGFIALKEVNASGRHTLVVVASCEDTNCLDRKDCINNPSTCATPTIAENSFTLPDTGGPTGVRMQVIGALTHGKPKDLDVINVNSSNDFIGSGRPQNMAIEHSFPEVTNKQLSINFPATEYLQDSDILLLY